MNPDDHPYNKARPPSMRRLTQHEIEQRERIEKRLAGRPMKPREAMEHFFIPTLREDE